jgi:uncharacterized membrane protein YoaK (UPF0700 family)
MARSECGYHSPMAISPSPQRGRDVTLWLLACAAGCVDAVSYLALGQVFVANMTGNTVLLGIATVELEASATLRVVLSLAGFVGGAAAGTLVLERAASLRPGQAVFRVLACQIVLMVIAAWYWRVQSAPLAHADILVPLLSIAMGLQTVAARRLDRFGISTTFITGSLTALVSRVIAGMHGALIPAAPTAQQGAGAGVLAVIWGLYVGGAAVGAWLARSAPAGALLIPLALVVIAAMLIGRDRSV